MGGYTDADIEADITAAGKTAPRVGPDSIDGLITAEDYYRFPGTTVTICCLTLRNGYCVTGHSAAASPDNFDEAIGRKIARQKARDEIWPLEGYLLRERLSTGGQE